MEHIFVEGEHVVVLADFRHTVRTNWRSFHTQVAVHFVVVNGATSRLRLYEDTLAVAHAFGLRVL